MKSRSTKRLAQKEFLCEMLSTRGIQPFDTPTQKQGNRWLLTPKRMRSFISVARISIAPIGTNCHERCNCVRPIAG
jgi:hypothetical protein